MALTLLAQQHPLASSDAQRDRLARTTACPSFNVRMAQAGLAPLHATSLTVLQINVGKLCNQTCRHCHVDAGPDRREQMTPETAALCIPRWRRVRFRPSISRVERRS
jgi:sulfatase maturation enzyme AslB (radical SAM superfamily)